MTNRKLKAIAFGLACLACGPVFAAGDAEAGKEKAASCAGCHGAQGEGSGPNPPIAGLDADTHLQMLIEYKAGERGEALMQMFAAQLSEQDMADIAAYYACLEAAEG
ncbi:MAG: c-type cytochrome [Xanthomonadales bacterium]|nr:c-type cytochrome [Xanthomonadales bacterium]